MPDTLMPSRPPAYGIHVYGDSLSMPRSAIGIGLTDTYPELFADILKSEMERRFVVWNRSGGALTIKNLFERYRGDVQYIDRDERQVLILQFGVVDCAPRPLPRLLRGILSRSPKFVREPVIQLIHAYRPFLLRAKISFRFTPPGIFEQMLATWLDNAADAYDSVMVMGIAPTNSVTEAQSPGFMASIHRYNEIMRRTVESRDQPHLQFIDIHGAILKEGESGLVDEDGHHLTLSAHRLYAQLLFNARRRISIHSREQEGGVSAPSRLTTSR